MRRLLQLIFLLALALWFWQQWNLSKSSWEGLGDAHFYAIWADHYVKTDENKWFEVYPVALSNGSGAEMSFSAFGHPLWSSFLIQFGWTSSEATLLASLTAFVAMLFSVGFWVSKGLGFDRALLVITLMLLLPKVASYSHSGGPEALSLFFLVNALGCLLYVRGRMSVWILVILCSVLGAFVRPHNQIFLLALVLPAFFSFKDKRWRFMIAWLVGLATFKIIGVMSSDHDLKFGYLFSFLVGTDLYPQHSLFRTYFSDGFQASMLLENKDQLKAKTKTAIALLKMYWTGWLPQVGLLCLCVFLKPNKSAWLATVGLLSAILFLAGMGHLVPRYWEMLQPVTCLFFIMTVIHCFKWDQTQKSASVFSLLLGLGVLGYLCFTSWSYVQKRDVRYQNIPVQLVERIEGQAWVACTKPSKLIDLWKKPVLLLPESVEMIEKIHAEVKALNALVLTPDYQKSEYAQWIMKNEAGLRLNWNVERFEDWTLLTRRN